MILRSAEGMRSTAFLTDDVNGWEPGALESLTSAGVLRPGELATSVTCSGCERACIEDVEFVGDGEESPRAYVVCSEREDMGRVEVPLERLRTWVVDLGGMAQHLKGSLTGRGPVEELVPGRVWSLGRVTFTAGRADTFLARGTSWDDADEAIAANSRLQQCSRALVLTLSDTHPDWLPGRVCLSMGRLLAIEEGQLTLDRDCIEEEAARRFGRSVFSGRKFPTPPGSTWERVSIVITADGDEAVVTAGSVTQPASPAQMGMAYARNPHRLTEQWHLLVLLADRGALVADGQEFSLLVPKRIERLRKDLQAFFGIEDDPFKPYRQVNGYDTRFALRRIGH